MSIIYITGEQFYEENKLKSKLRKSNHPDCLVDPKTGKSLYSMLKYGHYMFVIKLIKAGMSIEEALEVPYKPKCVRSGKYYK